MIVITMNNCPPRLRGDLSKWLLEVNIGVYVGQVSARVRDALWKRVCGNISKGQATMVYSKNNEQHMEFKVYNTSWQPVDYDGIKLVRRPLKTIQSSKTQENTTVGYSNAAKWQMAKRKKKRTLLESYVIIDFETSGLKSRSDEIIEIGALQVVNGEIVEELQCLIQCEKTITEVVGKITGISIAMLKAEGIPLLEGLTKLLEMVGKKEIVCYNASFDCAFLESACEKCGFPIPENHVTDVMQLARNRIKDVKDYKLATIGSYLDVQRENTHRALDDCFLLHDVYTKLNEL